MNKVSIFLLSIIAAILLIASFLLRDIMLSDICRVVGFSLLFLASVLRINFRKRTTRNFMISIPVMFIVQLAVCFLIAQKQGEIFNITDMATNYVLIIFWIVYFGMYFLINLVCKPKGNNE